MKKILLTLFILIFMILFSVSANALTLAWDHDTPADVVGYVLYYRATNGSLGPFNLTINGGDNMTIEIPTIEFKPNVEYTFTVTAFNDSGESEHSEPLMWTRHGWGPPSDNVSSETYVKPGNPNNLREN